MSDPLDSGQLYEVRVEGTYYFAYHPEIPDLRQADGSFHFFTNGQHLAPPVNILGMRIDGEVVPWWGLVGDEYFVETYSPVHIYMMLVIGDGLPLSLRIEDTVYTDNVGGLDVWITPVPEPASVGLLALGGLALIRWRRTTI